MTKLLLASAALALVATPAFAKKEKHCVGKDKTEIADAKDAKACKAAGGKWKAKKGGAAKPAEKTAAPAEAAPPEKKE